MAIFIWCFATLRRVNYPSFWRYNKSKDKFYCYAILSVILWVNYYRVLLVLKEFFQSNAKKHKQILTIVNCKHKWNEVCIYLHSWVFHESINRHEWNNEIKFFQSKYFLFHCIYFYAILIQSKCVQIILTNSFLILI